MNLDFNETRADEVTVALAVPFAPHCRQITMPEPYHSIFYGPDALLDAQATVSKHHHHNCFTALSPGPPG